MWGGHRIRGRTVACATFFSALVLMIFVSGSNGIEHNLPEGVELVDPKDFGFDSQFDLNKLLGNVKALPIDTNALSSALGKPGLKTQVLTVGFDGSEGLNLDDFELPQLKNDEHAPLAQEAFASFKNFLRNSSMATQVQDDVSQAPTSPPVVQFSKPVGTRRPGGKRKMIRKVKRVNGTTTTPTPATEVPAATGAGPKVIELDSSQIERLIASGKIGPPKSLTPGGPQVIELGQKDLDALLNSDNGDEIKQILEGGDTIQNFDLSQLTGPSAQAPEAPAAAPVEQQEPQQQVYESQRTRVTESSPPVSHAQIVTSPLPTHPPRSTIPHVVEEATSSLPPQTTTTLPPQTENTQDPSTTPSTTTGLPIIYQYNSAQDQKNTIPPQGIQGAIPLQFYSSHANGNQQARLVKTPTFELISAPPVSFSSSVLQDNQGNAQQIQQQPQQPQQQQQFQVQHQPQTLFIQPQFFIPQQQQQQQQHFIPANPPPVQQQQQQPSPTPKPFKKDSSLNKIVPAAQTSHHTEEVKFKQSQPANNYISQLHKVNLPLNSVKLVTPSPQILQSVLSQVPDSFQPSVIPNHIVSSPVLDPLRVGNPPSQTSFIRTAQPQPPQQQQQTQPQQPIPFRNTHLFNALPNQPRNPPIRTHPSAFVRFPSGSSTSSVLSSPGPNRFRVAESQNPFFTFRPQTNGFGGLILNSFVAGDGLNYRARSREDFHSPGI